MLGNGARHFTLHDAQTIDSHSGEGGGRRSMARLQRYTPALTDGRAWFANSDEESPLTAEGFRRRRLDLESGQSRTPDMPGRPHTVLAR